MMSYDVIDHKLERREFSANIYIVMAIHEVESSIYS